MQFKVLQIDAMDQNGGAYMARLETTFKGSLGYKAEHSQYYKPVCNIDAEDLNGVFQIGNIGPEERITRLAPMHSVSVGDIIEDPAGTQYMVNSFGFKELTNV
jgi:hypothetical protein